jgi:phosphoglycerol transferase
VLLVLEILRRKYVRTNIHGKVFYGILFVMLVGGILDQTNNSMVPEYALCKEEFSRDETFIADIESELSEAAMVFQLPYLSFPESKKVNNMNDYNHLRGYLHSDSLRWSYPTMKGRDGDMWVKEVSGKSTSQMLRDLADAGFEGVYINRNGYQDGGVEIEQQLAAELHVIPIINEDRTLAFYDLSDYTEK